MDNIINKNTPKNQLFNNGYENYGDINPIDHGGVFVKLDKADRSENTFYILKNQFCEDSNQYLFYDLYIDISESWIEKEKVMSYSGMNEDKFNKIQFAIDISEYYSYENFGLLKIFDQIQELINEYNKYGIIELNY